MSLRPVLGVLLASYLTTAWAVQVTESSPTYVAPSERVSSAPKTEPVLSPAQPVSTNQKVVGNQASFDQSAASQTVAAKDITDDVEDFGIVTDSIEPANPLADDRALLVQELQILRAKVEDQERQISELKQRSKVLYEDLDRRLQKLAEKLVVLEKSPPVRPSITDSLDSEPMTASDMANDSSEGENDQTRYQKAKALLDEGGRDTEAAISFLRLLKAYPETPLKPNVYYWLAQIYKRGGEVDKAEGYYHRVLEEYPKSIKAASSLYSLASMKASQGQNAEANQLLNKLVAEYPNSAEAIKAQSKLNP